MQQSGMCFGLQCSALSVTSDISSHIPRTLQARASHHSQEPCTRHMCTSSRHPNSHVPYVRPPTHSAPREESSSLGSHTQEAAGQIRTVNWHAHLRRSAVQQREIDCLTDRCDHLYCKAKHTAHSLCMAPLCSVRKEVHHQHLPLLCTDQNSSPHPWCSWPHQAPYWQHKNRQWCLEHGLPMGRCSCCCAAGNQPGRCSLRPPV